jgi:hypothetical protein
MSETYPIVGAHFRPPAKGILEGLPSGCPLTLRPEPDNMFDPNAVMVTLRSADVPTSAHERLAQGLPLWGSSLEEFLASPEWHLGYVPRTRAVELAPSLRGADASALLTFSATGQPSVTRTKG